LRAINVSQPGSMVLGSFANTGDALDVDARAGIAVVAADTSGVAILDISTPLSPVVIGSVDPAARIKGVAIDGNEVYAAADTEGLLVYDISDPANPTLVGSYAAPAEAESVDVDSEAGLAYLNTLEGVVVLDIASCQTPFTPVGCAEDITGDGIVDVLDLNRVLAAFNQPASVDPPADITGDGFVDVLDLNALLALFNQACP
jgi:hypothetical protein